MKYIKFILIIILTIFFITNVKASDKLYQEISSKELINYLKKTEQINKVKYICTDNYCSKEMYGNREKEIEIFINNYISKVKKKSLEEGIKIELKGFKITKIVFNDF